MITVEAGRELDSEVLPEYTSWDIRRYGDTHIAIRVISGTASGLEPLADQEEVADV